MWVPYMTWEESDIILSESGGDCPDGKEVDTLLELYRLRSIELKQLERGLDDLRKDIRRSLHQKNTEDFMFFQHQADIVARKKQRVEDSFVAIEEELSENLTFFRQV